MYRIRLTICASIIFAGITVWSFPALAKGFTVNADVGMEYTNNARLAPENEKDDLVAITRVGAKIDTGSGPFTLNADTSLRRENYTRNSFTDNDYFSLGATANWEQVRNRINWTLRDYFSQQSIISTGANTPDNVQDVNVLTFGPNISFPISGRQLLTIQPEYQKFTYEVLGVDNQSNLLNVGWNYSLSRTMTVGLVGIVNEVNYDAQAVSDIQFKRIGLTASVNRARSNFNIVLGVTHADRDDSSERGLSGNLTWVRNLTGYSNIRTYISSNLTNSSSRLLEFARNPGSGDFSNQQITSEVVRNSIARVSYASNDTTRSSNVWVEIQNQDYEQSLLDQEVQALGFKFDFSVTAASSLGINLLHENVDLTDLDREDQNQSVSGSLNYRLFRGLRSSFSLKYLTRDSTLDSLDYTEFSVFVGLVYGYDSATR